jgi:hypothetical protein
MVRAKYRVMELKQMWNGEVTIVRLLPVSAKSSWSDDPEDSVENAAFWEATPSGEAELIYKGFVDIPFEIGKCVFIDMEQLDTEPAEEDRKGHWQLKSVKSSHSLDIELGRAWQNEKLSSGTIKMDIHNEGAWPPFLGNHLTHWSVTIGPAK